MNNIKKKNVILAFVLISSLLLFMQGKLNENVNKKEKEEWNVKVISDTNDLASKETNEIKFDALQNSNVAKGKIVPGNSAIATLYLDLIGTKYDVDFKLDIEKKLPNNFDLLTTIDGVNYKPGETITFMLDGKDEFDKTNGKKEIIMLLEWKDKDSTDNLDTIIGATENRLDIPINWEIKQHIN